MVVTPNGNREMEILKPDHDPRRSDCWMTIFESFNHLVAESIGKTRMGRIISLNGSMAQWLNGSMTQ